MRTPVAVAVACLGLSACATLTPPSAREMAALPVVQYGQPAPEGQPFILHYPAATPIPVVASVTGSLLERADQATLNVALKRDVYIHKEWLSFDGKEWMKGSQAVGGQFAITLPGQVDGRKPGTLSATFDLKQ